jgi:hypothetical protein
LLSRKVIISGIGLVVFQLPPLLEFGYMKLASDILKAGTISNFIPSVKLITAT